MKLTLMALSCLTALTVFECNGRDSDPDPDGGAECSSFNCDGCCTEDGDCLDGLSNLACGRGGQRCVECSDPARCASSGLGGGMCESCNGFNCDGCCTAEGVCVAGTADSECGHSGQSCTACTGVALCDPRGTGGGTCR